jgi:hypothetical protein
MRKQKMGKCIITQQANNHMSLGGKGGIRTLDRLFTYA